MTGIPLVIAFVIAIILMIVAISKWKIHPFLSIMSVSLLLAIVAGIDLAQIADVIGAGFSGTFTSMLRLAVCYAAVTALVQGARYIKRFCVRRFANDVNRRMKRILYGSLIRKSRAGEHQSQHRQPHQNLFHVILLAPPRDSRHIIA